MEFTGFGADALDFFDELTAHNDRAWWNAHKDRYLSSIADPMAALARTLEPEFGHAHVFRPQRDVRFSADKSPYKNHAALTCGTGSERAGGGTLYFHLDADGPMVGGGWWRPDAAHLRAFRAAIDDPGTAADLQTLLDGLAGHGVTLMDGDPVATAPRGWSRDHPQIELLRRRNLAVHRVHEPAPWLFTAELADVVAQDWRQVQRFVAWLEALPVRAS
ncbi:DUF2461 domain-containing protein [Cellulomonas soli]|uniref:TIGR02453 family protein n=1 Tax=Cellulomonas soli TaxID=931535 RepID=A0A512PCE3_9CELL|nr:DUF2461 domain-containing protein [Cellulomonas soli]NYI58458.1 uncharacterized protein (TIGR02453 family) [Cellulomonas soli]GEP68880.1 TIGR02453 family protein [Cellulomonas soli]